MEVKSKRNTLTLTAQYALTAWLMQMYSSTRAIRKPAINNICRKNSAITKIIAEENIAAVQIN